MGMAELRNQAATFDLNKLEQMESASVILDRNNKIFARSMSRTARPFPTTNCHAIWSMPWSRSRTRNLSASRLFAVGNCARWFENLVAGHVRQGASTITQQLARNSFALKGKTFRRKLLEIFVARRIEDISTSRRSWSFISTDLFRRRALWRGSSGARYFGNGRAIFHWANAPRSQINQESEPAFTVDGKAGSRDARNYALARMRDLGLIDNAKLAQAQSADLQLGIGRTRRVKITRSIIFASK